MRNLLSRIERLEEALTAGDCVCDRPENQVACVVIESGWSAEKIRLAEDKARFNCPKHGQRRPAIVRLSPTDALS